jgi:hypothetical protein
MSFVVPTRQVRAAMQRMRIGTNKMEDVKQNTPRRIFKSVGYLVRDDCSRNSRIKKIVNVQRREKANQKRPEDE